MLAPASETAAQQTCPTAHVVAPHLIPSGSDTTSGTAWSGVTVSGTDWSGTA